MTDKQTYYARKVLYLSILDPTTFERQATINKVLLALVVVLMVICFNLSVKFSALNAEIEVRRATSAARVQAWQNRVAQDSLQRIEWEAMKAGELANKMKLQNDSILSQIRRNK